MNNKLIEFAKKQCEIFPEDSYMGKYLRETLKMLQVKPCEDAVSRKAAVVQLYHNKVGDDDVDVIIERDIATIQTLPPVTPARKKGKWIIDDKENNRIWDCHCSECKKDPQGYIGGSEDWWVVRLPKYCPYCGSRNEVEE